METLYFFANAAMPGLLKIGYTSGSIEDRLRQLNTTGVPRPFYAVATFTVKNAAQCERTIHHKLAYARRNKNREFFKIAPERALIEVVPIISQFLNSTGVEAESKEEFGPSLDKDDIYFLQMVLHAQEPVSIDTLVDAHSAYAPLELEYKLLRLVDEGLIKQIKYRGDRQSWWVMTTKGIKFMFEGGHVLQDLIAEARPNQKGPWGFRQRQD